MEKFLGVLFCGGRGVRLGEISKYISKPLIPVYDKPVFKFGLELLKNSNHIDEILILTNEDNDRFFKNENIRTIVQDDNKVSGIFSGWEYVKEVTKTKKNAVLYPGDNICDADIDSMIMHFKTANPEFLFSLIKLMDTEKLSEMGSFDITRKIYSYRNPVSEMGVIAPYIIKNDLGKKASSELFSSDKSDYLIYNGNWYDIGDIDSILNASIWRQKTLAGKT
ncbi:MAG: hypothetical protein HGGPFJEG_01252 [Ignavibacteria bacterium]|nr:hypothetical protein [Ignavibacteria bacterium]